MIQKFKKLSKIKRICFLSLTVAVLVLATFLFIRPVFVKKSQAKDNLVQIANSDLVAHYIFDDCTATDSSGNGYNGIINGATCVASPIGGKAMSFDGTELRLPAL